MNSLMSMRTIASVESNRNPASALHNSVLPTPVGPRNRNDPFGRFGSDRPARERRIAAATYGGDPSFNGSASAALSHTTNPSTATVTISQVANPSQVNDPVTVFVTVSG